MKPNEFYPTIDTQGVDMLTTDTISNLNVTDRDTDPVAAYYMGKLEAENSLMKYGTFSAQKSGSDVSTYSYKFEQDLSVVPNWLYMTAGTNTYFTMAYNGTKWLSSYKLFNGFAPYKMCLNYGATLTLSLRMYDFVNDHTLGNGEHVLTNTSYWNYDLNLSGDNLFEFFDGSYSANVTFNGNNYSISYNGYNDEEHCWELGDGKRVYIMMANFPVNNTATYYNSISTRCDVINGLALPEGGSYANWQGEEITRPASVVFCHAYQAIPSDSRLDIDRHRYRTSPNLYNSATMYAFDGNNIVTIGGAPFEVSYIAARYATSQSKLVLTSTGVLLEGTGSDQVRVNYFVDLFALYRSGWGNITKHCTSKDKDGNVISGYTANTALYDKYQDVPLFSPDNVLLFRRKENKYKDLEPLLQPWQKYGYDINDDEFDPEDEGGGGTFDPDDDGDLPSKEDGIDTGEPPTVNHFDTNCSMTKFVAMSGTGWIDLKTGLAQAVADSANNPTDTTKLAYKLGTYKSDGVYEAANELSIFKFIASARFYPFDLSSLKFQNDSKIIDNNNVQQNLSFGYRGAVVHAPNCPLSWSIAWTKFYTIKVPLPPKIIDDSINSVTYKEFEPFTKYTLMLPYCGEMAIPAHNAIRATIGVQYGIDFNSGTCCALVVAGGGFNVGTEIIGVMSGTCSCGISVAGNDAVTQGDRMAAAQLNKQSTELALARAKFDFAVTTANAAINAAESGASFGDKGFAPGIGVAQSIAKSAPDIVHSAMDIEGAKISDRLADINCTQAQRSVPVLLNFGTNVTGTMCFDTPTLKTERTLILKPDGYKETYGYPTYQKHNLGALKGYFECANPEVKNVDSDLGAVPTEAELKMINDALRSGSYMGGT